VQIPDVQISSYFREVVMSQNNKNDFLATLFDGVANDAAKYLNKRIREFTPIALDWGINFLKKTISEKYSEFKARKTTQAECLVEINNPQADNVEKLGRAIETLETNGNDVDARNDFLDVINAEIDDNMEMWESLNLFVQEVKCPHCGSVISDNWEDYILGESSSERNMGIETIYSIECDEYLCPSCNQSFSIEGYICAYPDGIYDSHELKTASL
jgi:DNA-directed RNA polymerase subunit N (RpoN/RPB10)